MRFKPANLNRPPLDTLERYLARLESAYERARRTNVSLATSEGQS